MYESIRVENLDLTDVPYPSFCLHIETCLNDKNTLWGETQKVITVYNNNANGNYRDYSLIHLLLFNKQFKLHYAVVYSSYKYGGLASHNENNMSGRNWEK